MTTEVCFTYAGEFERAVAIEVFTEDIDAEEEVDYQGLFTTVNIETQGMLCMNVTLIQDSRLENDEYFTVNLISSDPAANFTLSRAEIIILDANRKFSNALLFAIQCTCTWCCVGIEVEFGSPEYVVTEDAGIVSIFVGIVSDDISLDREFEVIVTTERGNGMLIWKIGWAA